MAKYTHKLIAKVAQELANEAYEELSHRNQFYKDNPNRGRFVRRYWGFFIPLAREALGGMLASPNVAESQRVVIMDALFKDRSLPRKRSEVPNMGNPLAS